jgi:ribosomal protein L11 methyltransferase
MTVKATLTAAFPEARRISNFLERDYGGDGVAVSLDQRGDGMWSVEAYFERGEPAELAGGIRDRLGADAFGAPLVVEEVPETDWIAAGLERLPPVIAGRFVVHGRHDRERIPPGRVAIEIEAGHAFCTGHHATTAGCLHVLDGLVRTRRFANPLDLGTGSGVLAIALAKMLRRPVLATDIEPVAVRIATENARLNRVGNLVRTIKAAGVDHGAIRRSAPYDLVVANILAEPLCRLAPQLAPFIAPGGALVLSGLLPNQRERVIAAYRGQGLELAQARAFDGWCVLIMRRRSVS